MDTNSLIGYVVSILSGIAVTIPLVVELIKYVKSAVKSKDWGKITNLTLALMEDAEILFDNGADRKDWVITKILASSEYLNYEIDINAVSSFIDTVATASKKINRMKVVDVDNQNK